MESTNGTMDGIGTRENAGGGKLKSCATMLTRCVLIWCSLLACGDASSSREVTATNECSVAGSKIFVHALIRANYTTGLVKSARDLWQLDCDVENKSCAGIHLALENVHKGQPITMMDFHRLEGAELVDVVGSVATIRWGALRTFTVDFERGKISYVESGVGLAATEGRGETTCRATGRPLNTATPASNDRQETKSVPPAPAQTAAESVFPVRERVSCFSMIDMRLGSVSVCAFSAHACKAEATRLGAHGECRPADSMFCSRSVNGLECFGDRSTCMLRTESGDCGEVRYTQ